MILRVIPAFFLIYLVAACTPFRQEQTLTIKSIESEEFFIEADTKVTGSKMKALEGYQEFLATSPSSPMRAEAMRRLADLQLEISAGEQPDSTMPDQEEDHAAAIALYLDLLKKYPSRLSNDRVLYQLAKAYENSGKMESALDTLNRLVREFPATDYLDEVQFRRAEMLFVRHAYVDAAQAYEDVLAFRDETPFFEQALYKRGWSLFKQEEYGQALDAFFRMLDMKLAPYVQENGSISLEVLERADREMVDDFLRVSSLSFSYLSGAASISGYLSQDERWRYGSLVYDSLGKLYLDKERYNDAAITYHAFSEAYPDHGQAPLLQIQAIASYNKGAFPSLVLKEKLDFVARYGLKNQFWESHSVDELPEVIHYLKDTLVELARHYHAIAQQTKQNSDYQQAARWYSHYLGDFPGDERAPGLNYLLAEALFESGQYQEAALQYERTAYRYDNYEKGAEAGYAALLVYQKLQDHLGDSSTDRQRWRRQALASALRFEDRYPDHPQASAVLAKAAEDYFNLKDAVPAMIVAHRLLRKHPTAAPSLHLSAWKVIAFLEFDQQAYDKAEQAYLQVISLMSPGDSDKAEMVESLASSVYKQGEQQRDAGSLDAAAMHFLRVGKLAPEAGILPTAEYDAAAVLLSLQRWDDAVKVLNNFRRNYPSHRLQGEVTTKLAVAYLKNNQSVKAAQEFELIGVTDKDPRIRREAAWRAAQMYEQAKLTNRAAAAYKHYVQDFPDQFDQGIEARQKLAQLNDQVGNVRRYRYWLDEVIKADKGAGTGRTERSRYLAAKASLALAEPSYRAFEQVRLVIPLEKNLKLKKRKMELALSAYKQAADYSVAEVTTAATYKIAEIYHGLSEGLLESQRPKGLTAEELEEYDILLEEQAYPLEEQAITIHEVNVQRVTEGIYDDWVNASFQKLAGLLPVRYAKPEKSEKIVEVIY